MNAITTMAFANTLGLLATTDQVVIAAFATKVFFWTVAEEHVQVRSQLPSFTMISFVRKKEQLISVNRPLPLSTCKRKTSSGPMQPLRPHQFVSSNLRQPLTLL